MWLKHVVTHWVNTPYFFFSLQTCPVEWGKAGHDEQWDIPRAEAQDIEGGTDNSYASHDYRFLCYQKY